MRMALEINGKLYASLVAPSDGDVSACSQCDLHGTEGCEDFCSTLDNVPPHSSWYIFKEVQRASDICEVPGCTRPHVYPVYYRQMDNVMNVCGIHGDEILNRDHPEYECECPKCGCMMGVN